MRSSRRWLLGALLSLLLTAGAIPYLPAPFAIRPAFAAIAHVGTDVTFAGNGSNTNPTTVTLNQQPSSGDTLIVLIMHFKVNWTFISSVSGAGISSYSHLMQFQPSNASCSANCDIEVWCGTNASGSGGTTLTVTPGNTGDQIGIAAAEFSGVTCTLDGSVVSQSTANGSTDTAGNITTTNASDLLISAIYHSGSITMTIDGSSTNFGSTPLSPFSSGSNDILLGGYRIVTSTGTYAMTWTPSSGTWNSGGGIMAFQASAAAAVTTGGPDTFPLLGVGSGGSGGGGGIAQPPGGQVGTRDPALQPFATNSVWNYPIGTSATTSTGPMADGRTWAQEQAAFPGNMYVQVPAFTFSVVIAKSSDPVVTFCLNQSAASNMNTLYGTTRFDRHAPSFSTGSGESEIGVISPDHLVLIEQYNPVSGTACNGLSTEFDIGSSFGNANVNVDLKGPGVFKGAAGSDVGCGSCGDMGIALTSGDASSPANIVGITNGNPIGSGGQISASKTSAIGGLIRKGELANGIPHALRLEAGIAMLNRNAPGSHNFVWPAASCDGGTCTNYGTSGNLYMGNLVMIAASSTCTGHTFNTTAGSNICLALARYGGYIVDTACNNCLLMLIDFNAENEVPSQNSSSDLQGDDNFIFQNLVTVTNSYHSDGTAVQTGKKIDGGDGTVSSSLIPPAFDALYGGGNGRSSYFRPFIPWARLAKAFAMFRVH